MRFFPGSLLKSARFFMGVLTLVLALNFIACTANYFIPEYDYIAPDPGAALAMLDEIDAYRATDPTHRSIENTRSEDPTYLTMDDTVTTAGAPFSGPIYHIGLIDVLLNTMKNNRNVRVEQYNRSIAKLGKDAAGGIYDLLLSSSLSASRSKTQDSRRDLTGDPATNKSRRSSFSLGLAQLLPTGGTLSLSAEHNFVKIYNDFFSGFFADAIIAPYDTVTFGASIVQPLLRGAGRYVTNAPILLAAIEENVAREDFRKQVILEMSLAVKQYWDLVFAINNYEVQRLSMQRATELLRVETIKSEAGVEPPNVVLQAKAEVAHRDAQLIDARRQIADASDALKRAMNITQDSEQWRYNLIPIDRAVFVPAALDEEELFDEALMSRPDYRAALLGLEAAEVNRRLAKNALLPQLDATAGYQVSGLEDSFGSAMDEAETLDYTGWNVGLALSYPLQNRGAKARYQQTRERLAQQREVLANIKEIIRLEVRTAIRAIQTNQELIAAWDVAIDSEKAKLDSQKQRYDVGLGTIFEVLQFQEDLAESQALYLQAVVNYNKAMIELQRIKASFLSDYRVEFIDKVAARREAAEAANAAGENK